MKGESAEQICANADWRQRCGQLGIKTVFTKRPIEKEKRKHRIKVVIRFGGNKLTGQ